MAIQFGAYDSPTKNSCLNYGKELYTYTSYFVIDYDWVLRPHPWADSAFVDWRNRCAEPRRLFGDLRRAAGREHPRGTHRTRTLRQQPRRRYPVPDGGCRVLELLRAC